MKPTPIPREDVRYPSSDGRRMAENDWQRVAIINASETLDMYYRDRPNVYVSADLLIYYEEGDPAKAVAPDVFVVFGAAKRPRMVYKLWEEPKAPDFVLEVASGSTWKQDRERKRVLVRATRGAGVLALRSKGRVLPAAAAGIAPARRPLSADPCAAATWRAGLAQRRPWVRLAGGSGTGAFSSPRDRASARNLPRVGDGSGSGGGSPARRGGTPAGGGGSPARRGGTPADGTGRASRRRGRPARGRDARSRIAEAT